MLAAETVDFEQAPVGSIPSGWTAAMTHEGGAPRWEVKTDGGAASGSRVLAQLSDDPTSGRFPLAIHDASNGRQCHLLRRL
jgi:hypothetical protein